MDLRSFLEELAHRYPSDLEDLENSWQILEKQRISTVDRLVKLGDSQWARLNIPLGVEAIIREELSLIPAQDEEDSIEESTLRQRGKPVARPKPETPKAKEMAQPQLYLEPPSNLEEQFHQLLVDTLPPDRREMLLNSWRDLESIDDRYMMFLEYSSYLRKPEMSDKEREEHEKKMEPLLHHYGISKSDDDSRVGLLPWIVIGGVGLFAIGFYYYAYPGEITPHEEML